MRAVALEVAVSTEAASVVAAFAVVGLAAEVSAAV
jgi:hypothetical protein